MNPLDNISVSERAEIEGYLQKLRAEKARERKIDVDGPIEFVIVGDIIPRTGSYVKVSNRFSSKTGEVTQDLGNDAYLVKVMDAEIVAHLDYKTWPEGCR